MPTHLQDALDIYLLPLMIAVPVIIVLYLLATSRKKTPPAPPRAQTAAAPTAAPAAPPAAPVHAQPPTAPAAAHPAASPSKPAVASSPAQPVRPGSGPLLGPQPEASPKPAPASAAPGTRPSPTPAPSKSAWNDTQLPEWADTHPPALLDAQDTVFTELPLLLLVDDSAVVRAKLRKLFDGAGFATEIARDGLEALTKLQGNRYALMITDMEMPNMDGVALIAAVARNPLWRTMPILAITGHDDLQAKARECHGVSGIFKKPWADAELLGRVESLLQASILHGG